ncbi:hypothetical protein ES703_05621 [subsurface metagenome]
MKRFSMVAGKQGLEYIRIPSMVWVVATILIASSSAPAHLDPPDDPPILTEVFIDELTFLTDQDDWTNGLAELRVMYTVDWGPGHGTTPALWARDHNFDTIPPPFSPIPPLMMIGSHIECTPAADPIVSVRAWESDQGIDPLLKLIAALVGRAAGGTAGQLIARFIVGVLSFFNPDDPLTLNVDFKTTYDFSQKKLPDGPCSVTAGGYSATMGAGYRAAAEYSSDPEIANMYREYATYGVDDDHPFSRNASYASQRFAYLFQAIEEADALTIEPGESGDVEPAKQAVRETAVDMAQIVADATVTEAMTMGLDSTLLSKAQSLISSAEVYASAGNYHSAISFYEDATILLLPEMFPEFILLDFYPPDGAVDIPLDAKLCWPKSEEAESYDVYFGTNFDHVKYGRVGTFKGSQLGTTYDPGTLEPCYDYYWKIESVIEEEEEEEPPIIVDSVITTGEVRIYDNMYSSGEAVLGDVWSFTTAGRKATNPYPVDGAICVDPNVLLSWTPGCLAAFHDVYFGTDFYAVANADTSDTTGIYRVRLDVNSYDPGTLEPGTAYYWKIEEANEPNKPPSTWQGPIWSFMTAAEPEPPNIPAEPVDLAPVEISYTSVGGGLFDVQVTVEMGYVASIADTNASVELFVEGALVGSDTIQIGYTGSRYPCESTRPPSCDGICAGYLICKKCWDPTSFREEYFCACVGSRTLIFSNVALMEGVEIIVLVDYPNVIEEWDETNNALLLVVTSIPIPPVSE